MISKRLLILEDDLLTLSKLIERLSVLEERLPCEFRTVVLSDHTQVQDYINDNPKAEFDIILLDRDDKLGASFHVLDIERFGAEKVISISSVPEANEDAKRRGVIRFVQKDYRFLDEFANKVVGEVEDMVRKAPLVGYSDPKESR